MKQRRLSFLLVMALAVIAATWGFYRSVQGKSSAVTPPAATEPQAGQAEQAGAADPKQPEAESPLKTQKDKASYSVGVNFINTLKIQGMDLDLELVMQGMKDAAAGGKMLLSDVELRRSTTLYHAEVRRKQEKARALVAESNKKQGEAFLAENQKKEGVVTLPSGLQYRILGAGDGKMPGDMDTVLCRYRGTLIDGTEFDSSTKQGGTTVIKIADAIPGWKEALKLMPVGAKWELFVPSQLAYGERGTRTVIGPNATLIFEVELLAIQ